VEELQHVKYVNVNQHIRTGRASRLPEWCH